MAHKFFEHWDSISDLADWFGVTYSAAQSWVHRGSIPAKYDARRMERLFGHQERTAPVAGRVLESLENWSKERQQHRQVS